MKTIASSKMDCYPKAKLIGLALSLLVLTFPAMGEVTTSKVDIPVVGSKCNERVKEVGSVSGVLRFPSKALGKVPAVVLLHSNAGIVGVGDFYARSLNAVGIVVCSTDCFRVEAHKRLRDKTGSYRCNSDPRPCKSPKG